MCSFDNPVRFYHIDHKIIHAKFLHHLSADTTGIGIFHGILSYGSTGNGDSGKRPLSFTDSLEKAVRSAQLVAP